MNKELKRLLNDLEQQRFQIIKRTSGHLMVRSPDGQSQTILALTGSDHRGHKNALSRLKKMGYKA